MWVSCESGVELRLLEQRHAESLYALVDRNRGYLRRWLGWVDSTQSAGDIRTFIKVQLQQFVDNGAFAAGIWVAEELTGVVSFHRIDWADRATSLGYWLSADRQGSGVMTTACRQMLDYAFGELKLNRMEIHCAVGNAPSRAVPERLGMTQGGILHGAEWVNDHYVDHVVYTMPAGEWPTTNEPESPR